MFIIPNPSVKLTFFKGEGRHVVEKIVCHGDFRAAKRTPPDEVPSPNSVVPLPHVTDFGRFIATELIQPRVSRLQRSGIDPVVAPEISVIAVADFPIKQVPKPGAGLTLDKIGDLTPPTRASPPRTRIDCTVCSPSRNSVSGNDEFFPQAVFARDKSPNPFAKKGSVEVDKIEKTQPPLDFRKAKNIPFNPRNLVGVFLPSPKEITEDFPKRVENLLREYSEGETVDGHGRKDRANYSDSSSKRDAFGVPLVDSPFRLLNNFFPPDRLIDPAANLDSKIWDREVANSTAERLSHGD